MFMRKRFVAGLVFAAAALLAAAPASARSWNPKSTDLALEYLQVDHDKGKDGFVLLWWLASPMFAEKDLGEVLDKNFILATVHMRMSADGTASFDSGDPQVIDGDGKPLKLIATPDLSPVMSGTVTALQTMMERTIGAMGKGMHIYVFDSGSVHACRDGHLSIAYEGETYTFDTPVPGCPAK